MKKAVIIVAIILIGVGTALFVGALAIGGNLKPMKTVTETYPVSGTFTDIRIDTHELDVSFAKSQDGACSVESSVAEKVKVNASVQDGVLTIQTTDERTWVDHLFRFENQTATVYLPCGTYRNLAIETHTGNVNLPNGFAFEQIQIITSTGDMSCGASATGAITIQTGTGDQELNGVTAESLFASASTGEIVIRQTSIRGGVTLNVTTGKVQLEGLTCKTLQSEGSTGRITLTDTLVEESMRIKRGTGDVRFENSDAGSIAVETSTGDVEGTLRTGKQFVAHSSTGKVLVPASTDGGRCEISVGTGDIRIELVNADN